MNTICQNTHFLYLNSTEQFYILSYLKYIFLEVSLKSQYLAVAF